MRMPKVGEKVRILSSNSPYSQISIGRVYNVINVNNTTFDVNPIGCIDYEPNWFSTNTDTWEIVSEANPEKSSTTTAEVEMSEVQDITHSISEAIFHDGFKPPKVLAKANDVVGALITIMVAKGIITKQDVKRILASPRPSV